MIRHAFFFCGCLFCLCGLSAQNLSIVTSTSFLADITAEVAGDKASVVSLLPVGTDPHTYDPVPEDARIIADADLIIMNGLTLEGWIQEMIDHAGQESDRIVVTDGIAAIESNDHPGAKDPHAWMNPLHVIVYAENIRDGLIAMEPSSASYFQERCSQYTDQLLAIDQYIERKLSRIPDSLKILATSHDAFRYYGQRYGIEVRSILGTSTEAEPTIDAYSKLLDQLFRLGIPAVFVESTVNPKLLTRLADDLNIVIGGKLYADSLGDDESGADTYLKMIRQNTDIIVAGLLGMSREGKTSESWFIYVVLAAFILAFCFVAWKLRMPDLPSGLPGSLKVTIEGLSVSYDKKTAISNIYLAAESGLIYGLLGGNGSGKSTLFKAILGLVEPDAGKIELSGHRIEEVRRLIAYIPQKEEIDWSFPATVQDIVLMGRYPHKNVFSSLSESDKAQATNAMRQLGIESLKDKQIGQLSGGQQQRAFIARALCQDAKVFLFDEPFVGVDITTEAAIMEIVRILAKKGHMIMIIHHDLSKVPEYFDHVIMINQRIIASGPTEEVFTDENIQKTYGGQLTILQKMDSYR